MKAVVQRVKSARVSVGGREVGAIGPGLLVFLGVAQGDADADADYMAKKIGKMNLSALDKGYSLLVISQFTLLADTRKGNRPNFMNAAAPAEGERLYELFVARARELLNVATGEFGAMMEIDALNDGPVTIIIESKS